MRYFIKNKLVSLGNGSYVLDENGNNAFTIRGKVFSPTHKKFIYDMQGNLLFTVRNKFWRFLRRSAIIYDNRTGKKRKVGRMIERFFVGWQFVNCKENLTLEGKFFEGRTVLRDGEALGKFKKQGDIVSAFIRDAYVLDVYSPEDTAFLVAVVIAHDNICDARERL